MKWCVEGLGISVPIKKKQISSFIVLASSFLTGTNGSFFKENIKFNSL